MRVRILQKHNLFMDRKKGLLGVLFSAVGHFLAQFTAVVGLVRSDNLASFALSDHYLAEYPPGKLLLSICVCVCVLRAFCMLI